MSCKDLFSKTAFGGLLISVAGCATTGQQSTVQQSNDPCYGVMITPHTAANRAMTEASAGLQRNGGGYMNERSRQFMRAYGYGYNPGYYNSSSVLFDNQGKPSEIVYTVTSKNDQVHDVKFKNNTSNFNQSVLTILGAAIGSQIGGHAVANAIIVGAGGAYAGNQLDGARNNGVTEQIKACLRDVQAGNQDYVIPKVKPADGVLPNRQVEPR